MLKNAKYLLLKHNKLFSLCVPNRLFLTASFKELEHFPKEIQSYEALHKYSIEQSDTFWSVLARSRLDWIKDFTQVSSGKFGDRDFHLKWFLEGKLNVSGKINSFFRNKFSSNKIKLFGLFFSK